MALGTLNHLAITVSDRTCSEPFYDAILAFMGYQQVERTDNFTLWWSQAAGAIEIVQGDREPANPKHDRYSPGLHHLALNADSREQVDIFYQKLIEMGATILDAPAEYNYSPGYYAVFFADPDGIKLELVHMPEIP